MTRSSRHRSRKHGSWEEKEAPDSDEDSRERRRLLREGEKAAGGSKGSETEKRLLSALARAPAAEDNGDASLERRKKRKDRDEEAVAGDDRWNVVGRGGSGREDGLSYYDSKEEGSRRADGEKPKKTKGLDADAKEKASRKGEHSDRHDESGGRKSEKEAVLKEDSAQYKVAKERAREHGAEKGKESRHEGPSKDSARWKEAKARDSEEDRMANKYNATADCQVQDKLCKGEAEEAERHMKRREQSAGKDKLGDSKDSKDRQMQLREDHVKTVGYDEERARDERYKDERSRDMEGPREGKYKDERSRDEERPGEGKYKDDRPRDEERPRDRKYKDERPKEEERSRDERYKKERSRNEDRPNDERYREERPRNEERPKDERYKDERSRQSDERYKEERPRNDERARDERYKDERSREKYYRDDPYRNQRHQDGRTRDERSDKHHRDEYYYSDGRYNKIKVRDSDENISAVDERNSKYRDDVRQKKRTYEENEDHSGLKPRSGQEQHGDAPKRKSEVSSLGSTAVRRRDYLLHEKVDSQQQRDYQKSSPRSSMFPIREQSRHFSKQEESTSREYGGVSAQHQRSSDFRSAEEQNKMKSSMNESSIPSKDNKSSRSSGQPIHFTDRSSSGHFSQRSNIRHSHDTDDLHQKNNYGEQDLPLNRKTAENLRSGSPVDFPPPLDRVEIGFEEDNRGRPREWRSSSRSRRGSTVNNTRGHGSSWKNPPAWASPVPNGFAPFQHGPPIHGFHPAMHHYPPQHLYGIRPSLDMNHPGIPYPLHDTPDRFSGRVPPFPWHNPAEDPYLHPYPGWDANRNVYEEYPHGYDRPEFDRNRHMDYNLPPEIGISSNAPVEKPLPVQALNQSQHSNAESSEIKSHSETIAAKTDAVIPQKVKSETKPGPSIATVDRSKLSSNYLKRLHLSVDLATPELYQKCVTMMEKLDQADPCNCFIRSRVQNTRAEYMAQEKGSSSMMKSLFPAKRNDIFENAMALYKTLKAKDPSSSFRSQGEEVVQQASETQMEEDNIQVPEEEPAIHPAPMQDSQAIDDAPQHGGDLDMANDSEMVDVQGEQPASIVEEQKSCTNNGEQCTAQGSNDPLSPTANLGVGCTSHAAEEQQVPAARVNAEGTITDVAKEQPCDVISDAAFASSSEACEAVMPDCRVNLSRIPCSRRST